MHKIRLIMTMKMAIYVRLHIETLIFWQHLNIPTSNTHRAMLIFLLCVIVYSLPMVTMETSQDREMLRGYIIWPQHTYSEKGQKMNDSLWSTSGRSILHFCLPFEEVATALLTLASTALYMYTQKAVTHTLIATGSNVGTSVVCQVN